MLRRFRFIAAALAVCGLSCRQAQGGEHATGSKAVPREGVEVGLLAPGYRAVSLAGDSTSLNQHRGHVVLLNVWATWCIPCRVELPVLQRLHQRYGPKGLDVIGVSVDKVASTESIASFARNLDVGYTIWLDPKNEILKTYLVVGVPATFVIGRDGTLLYKYLGPIHEGDPDMHRVIQLALRG